MPPGSRFAARVRAELDALREEGLERSLHVPCGIDLCSNDYLNLSRHPRVRTAFAEAVEREGCGSTGSRLLRGERACFAAVEARFAAFKGAERALYFATGYQANVAVLSTLPAHGDVIYSDERNHASIIDGVRLSRAAREIFPHNDAAALAGLLRRHRRASPGIPFVVVESLFSMDGDVAPLAEYAAACRDSGAVLIVDEAHAVGVAGQRGSGLLEEAGGSVADLPIVSVNTAGKALGVAGAFVAGPADVVELLVQRARPFVFSTAPPPALAAAIDAALDVVDAEPERRTRLRARAGWLRQRLAAEGFAVAGGTSHIVPIVVGASAAAVAVAAALQADGFDVRAIRPPTVPRGTARLRLSVNAALDEPTLDRFVEALAVHLEQAGLCAAGCS